MADKPVLLNDAEMQRFIREGYLVMKPDFPDGFHEKMVERIDKVFEKGGNPGNNLLPAVPQLQDVWGHPLVHGAFCSILGPDYYLHLHRHVHESHPGTDDQRMHKDSLFNSRFAADHNRRQHHTRCLMAFYYPQDTPVELGPTAIIPKSQYMNVDKPAEEELFTDGPAGTICIVHYDLYHRRVRNTLDYTRHMVKFLFARMSEPTEPTWDHHDATWQSSEDPQEATWQYMWDWHRGVAPQPVTEPAIEKWTEQLGGEDEALALESAYALGRSGTEGISVLIDGLKDQTSVHRPRNAGYGLNAGGETAAAALIEVAKDSEAQIRARAVDVLGDLGLSAQAAIPTLVDLVSDEDEDVRARAAESLGTCGQTQSDFVPRLAQVMLNDESDLVRRNAALSLARLGSHSEAAVSELAQALNDDSHYVRGFAVYALERIGTPEALKAALHFLQTTRWDQGSSTLGKRDVPHQKPKESA